MDLTIVKLNSSLYASSGETSLVRSHFYLRVSKNFRARVVGRIFGILTSRCPNPFQKFIIGVRVPRPLGLTYFKYWLTFFILVFYYFIFVMKILCKKTQLECVTYQSRYCPLDSTSWLENKVNWYASRKWMVQEDFLEKLSIIRHEIILKLNDINNAFIFPNAIILYDVTNVKNDHFKYFLFLMIIWWYSM